MWNLQNVYGYAGDKSAEKAARLNLNALVHFAIVEQWIWLDWPHLIFCDDRHATFRFVNRRHFAQRKTGDKKDQS